LIQTIRGVKDSSLMIISTIQNFQFELGYSFESQNIFLSLYIYLYGNIIPVISWSRYDI